MVFSATLIRMDRVVNRDARLYGPGPVRRVAVTHYGKMPPLKGFAMCATHAMVVGMAGAFVYKFMWGDPATRAIEDYYKENPPK